MQLSLGKDLSWVVPIIPAVVLKDPKIELRLDTSAAAVFPPNRHLSSFSPNGANFLLLLLLLLRKSHDRRRPINPTARASVSLLAVVCLRCVSESPERMSRHSRQRKKQFHAPLFAKWDVLVGMHMYRSSETMSAGKLEN